MERKAKVLVAGAAAGAVVAAAAVTKKTKDTGPQRHAITVNRTIDRNDRLPSPLAAIADGIELEFRPAPGDRGTEIHARSKGEVDEGTIRRALRETRSLIEVGDVLLPDGPPTTEPTLLNRPLRAATQHGREGGLL